MSGSKFCEKTFDCLIAKDGLIRGIKSGKIRKLQITYRIGDSLQHENPPQLILTSIELVQKNSPNIQTLIKKLHDLIYEKTGAHLYQNNTI